MLKQPFEIFLKNQQNIVQKMNIWFYQQHSMRVQMSASHFQLRSHVQEGLPQCRRRLRTTQVRQVFQEKMLRTLARLIGSPVILFLKKLYWK